MPITYIYKPYVPAKPPAVQGISIAAIGAVGMHYNLRDSENEAFYTSIYEIDTLLKRKDEQGREREVSVPQKYHDYVDVFSKEASDVLPPHRPYDYKIDIEDPVSLGYSPLYKITTEELKATKEYILNNLYKGFIKHS